MKGAVPFGRPCVSCTELLGNRLLVNLFIGCLRVKFAGRACCADPSDRTLHEVQLKMD